MNKKQLPVLLSGFLLFGSLFAITAAHADDMPGAIAVVDVQEILQTAPQVNAMKEKLKSDFASRQSQLLTAQKTLKADIDKLQSDPASKDKKALENLQKQIEAEQRDIQTKQMAFQKDLFSAQDKALQTLLEQVKSKIAQVAEEKKLSMVLLKNSVPYMKDKKADITADVKKLMK